MIIRMIALQTKDYRSRAEIVEILDQETSPTGKICKALLDAIVWHVKQGNKLELYISPRKETRL